MSKHITIFYLIYICSKEYEHKIQVVIEEKDKEIHAMQKKFKDLNEENTVRNHHKIHIRIYIERNREKMSRNASTQSTRYIYISFDNFFRKIKTKLQN